MPVYRNEVNYKDLAHINRLLHILSESARDLSELQLEDCLRQKNFEIVSARNERLALFGAEGLEREPIYGMATVHFSKVLGSCFAYIDDVVVDPNIQSRGLGTGLTKELISIARERGARWVALTSAPKRVAANIIYSRLMTKLLSAQVFILKANSLESKDLSQFLDYSEFSEAVDSQDVHVVNTLMGRKAFISNDVVSKYPPVSILEMVWVALAQNVISVEVVVDYENLGVADLLLQRGFVKKETNAYRLNF